MVGKVGLDLQLSHFNRRTVLSLSLNLRPKSKQKTYCRILGLLEKIKGLSSKGLREPQIDKALNLQFPDHNPLNSICHLKMVAT